MNLSARVHLLLEDETTLHAAQKLLESSGIGYLVHRDPQRFLNSYEPRPPECLVLGLRLAATSGLQLQRELRILPVVFVTSHGDISSAVTAMKQGAVDYLQTPFEEDSLFEAITRAVLTSEEKWRSLRVKQKRDQQLSILTPREREILDLVLEGHSSKKIARMIHRSKRTVDLHRANIMHKIGANSLVDLIRITGEPGSDTHSADG